MLGLEYIHSNNIIHRDIKPENLIIDEHGYIHITDFGIARTFYKNNKKDTSGTPGYMAPEILCAQNHKYEVDFYAIGVIIYEFMLGKRPYKGKTRKEIRDDVISRQAKIDMMNLPDGWSVEVVDFVNQLLQRKNTKRLGYNGIQEIKEHAWLKGVDWDGILHKKITAPYIPKNGDNYNKKYCQMEDKLNQSTIMRYQKYRNEKNYREAFNNYTWNEFFKAEVNEYYNKMKRKHKKHHKARGQRIHRSKTVDITKEDNDTSRNNNNNNINKSESKRYYERFSEFLYKNINVSKKILSPKQINNEITKRGFNRQQLLEEAQKGNLYISPTYKGIRSDLHKIKYKSTTNNSTLSLPLIQNNNNTKLNPNDNLNKSNNNIQSSSSPTKLRISSSQSQLAIHNSNNSRNTIKTSTLFKGSNPFIDINSLLFNQSNNSPSKRRLKRNLSQG